MPNMKKNFLKIAGILSVGVITLNSCGDKTEPPLVYFPDMYFPVAYDPLMKAQDPYSDHENEIPAFASRNGQTGLSPVEGSVAQNKDGVLPSEAPKNTEDYNRLYDESKKITSSPLNPANKEKDLERGKKLFDHTCAACHGTGGDGKGPIVESGAYSGVPNYADREITVGSVHYVLENGRNNMGSYAGQLNAGDRWRVAMYVMTEFKKQAAAPAAAENKDAAAKDAPADNANTKK
ncbi:c-type cytochrome [Elizabethkingia ursingii]|uniref:c-type cytochrome n=1 Tax=Elizabethkingia ursingii TaxID=1756150 RepID=UPI002011B96E|nr:c-type cytochrome [Elizabethkingia ursingii]MCL1667728.1 c-type cytochrome [Elizabethkingia ursingii]